MAASIQANGIIQPLIVRKVDGQYQIVAGERRWRAAKLAGLTEVPVVVQDVADPEMLVVALIENVQREDLNAIETAQAYDRLSRELGLSHEEIGRRTGKERTSISNMVRLLKLPAEVQQLVADDRLPMGHARAFLRLSDPEEQIRLAEKAAAQGLSAREVEALVRREINQPKGKKEDKQDPNVEAALEVLRRILQTKIKIVELSDQQGQDRDPVLLAGRFTADLRADCRGASAYRLKPGAGGRTRTCDLRIMRPPL